MDSLTLIITTSASVIAIIVGFIQLRKWRSQRKSRPYLDMEVRYTGYQSTNKGISPNAMPRQGENYFRNDETLHVFEHNRVIEISIINNSEEIAFYPQLFICEESIQPVFLAFDTLVPIEPVNVRSLSGTYTELEEKIPRERTQAGNFPSVEQKENFSVLIQYQNTKRTKFFTVITGLTNGVEHLTSMPHGYIPMTHI